MASSTARVIDRRDAAVSAALAGTVLVILGYASGIGLRSPAEVVAALPQPAPATPTTATPATAGPIITSPPPPVAQPALPVAHLTVHPSTPATTPTSAPPTEPGAAPPATPAASCPTGPVRSALGTVPLVDDASTLVTGLLGSVPLVGPILVPADPDAGTGLVGCTLGLVTGQTCCSTAATAARASR